jgi:4Fe-4S ferredoxin
MPRSRLFRGDIMRDLPDGAVSKRTNAAKVRKAANDPKRPSAGCKAPPKSFAPRVDHAKCEAKGDGVEVCPYDVFEVTAIDDADYRGLSWFSRMKVRLHGMRTAYTPRADNCLACGLCVVACPEQAIRLIEL